MNDDARIFAHVAQERAARVLALAFAVFALGAWAFGHSGPALALALMGGAANLARPGPSPDLDRVTGR